MKTFVLHRKIDESGVSGTGIVAEGIVFNNRKCAISWLSDLTSVAVYDNIETVEAIHGHDGDTEIVYTETE